MYIYRYIYNWWMGQVNNNISFDPLHCVSWDFHPVFIWILSLIFKK